MNIRLLFSSFRRRLLLEAAVRSLVLALTFGAFSVCLVSLGFHIALTRPPVPLLAAVFLIVFVLSAAAVFFLRLYPNDKRVAQRIDGIGLQERIGTMLEYREIGTEIAGIQRADALRHIGQVLPEEMPLQFRKKEILLCLVSLALAALLLLLPYDLRAFRMTVNADAEEQAQIVRDLIEELREGVKQAELEKEQKEALEEIINDLEEQLRMQENRSALDQAAQMQKAMDELRETLEESVTKDEIGEALQQYEMTGDLGEAIREGDTEGVSSALEELENRLNEDPSLVPELEDTIRRALEESGVDSGDALYQALEEFADALESAAEEELSGDELASALDEAFAEAEAAVREALEQQAAIEEEIARMEEALQNAKDEMLGNEPGESAESEGEGEPGEGEGEMPQQGMPQWGMPSGEMPSGDMQGGGSVPSDGTGEEITDSRTEEVYDPVSGSVAYGEVFAAYYAEYLDALEKGDVPADLQAIMDAYFAALE